MIWCRVLVTHSGNHRTMVGGDPDTINSRTKLLGLWMLRGGHAS